MLFQLWQKWSILSGTVTGRKFAASGIELLNVRKVPLWARKPEMEPVVLGGTYDRLSQLK